IFVLAVLVLVFARLQRAFQIDLRAFLQVLLDHSAKTLAEDHDPMPFGLLAPFAGRLVAPRLRGGDAKIGDRTAVLSAPDFGIAAEVAAEDPLVARTRHDTLLFSNRVAPPLNGGGPAASAFAAYPQGAGPAWGQCRTRSLFVPSTAGEWHASGKAAWRHPPLRPPKPVPQAARLLFPPAFAASRAPPAPPFSFW